jgi:hypothetical protein
MVRQIPTTRAIKRDPVEVSLPRGRYEWPTPAYYIFKYMALLNQVRILALDP